MKDKKRKGRWLEPTDAYWNQHNCLTPVLFGGRKPKSDRWACFCGKVFTYDYSTSEWMSSDE